MERKLAAILSADVKGYSRLMGEDDEATIRTLTAYREVMTTLIREHHGRVVDSPGDNLLAEFTSAVNAVEGAIAIQGELKTRNAELPASRKMEYRMGVNLGDVMEDDERLYGDGVNIAARLESLADAGGICISGKVFDEVRIKVHTGYDYLGEQSVKNIANPVPVYKVQLEQSADGTLPESRESVAPSHTTGVGQSRRWPWAVGAFAGLVVVGAVTLIWREESVTEPSAPRQEASSAATAQAPPLPDKPSIAVLPFTNMSGEPEQEHFSDGITEDVITDLAQLPGLFVISRNSTFTYKGQAVKIRDVGQELGVGYVLEGSVRKAGDRVRITAQLIDATTGMHVWAQRYDRDLQDVFAVQADVSQQVVAALEVQMTDGERARLARRDTDNVEAYESLWRGEALYWYFTKETYLQAQQFFERAIELDPQYASAWGHLAMAHYTAWWMGWRTDPETLAEVEELAQRALALDANDVWAFHAMEGVYWWQGDYEQALSVAQRSIELAPNDAYTHMCLGHVQMHVGQTEEAIHSIEHAMRLNPQYGAGYLWTLGLAYEFAERYEEALSIQQRALARMPMFWPSYLNLASIYTELGRDDEARAAAAEVLRLNPEYSLDVKVRQRIMYKDPTVLDRELAALRKAGLE